MKRFSENFDHEAFLLERSDFKNVIFEKIPWAPSEVDLETQNIKNYKKDEVCHSFVVEIFTKSLHRGGV